MVVNWTSTFSEKHSLNWVHEWKKTAIWHLGKIKWAFKTEPPLCSQQGIKTVLHFCLLGKAASFLVESIRKSRFRAAREICSHIPCSECKRSIVLLTLWQKTMTSSQAKSILKDQLDIFMVLLCFTCINVVNIIRAGWLSPGRTGLETQIVRILLFLSSNQSQANGCLFWKDLNNPQSSGLFSNARHNKSR